MVRFVLRSGRLFRIALAGAAFLVCVAQGVFGGTIFLRIRSANRHEKPQTVPIRSNLPDRITTNDIVDLDGLSLGYDLKTDRYFVHKDILLGPKEIEVFRVELRDVWNIPEEGLGELQEHTESLSEKLDGTEYGTTGAAMREQILETLRDVRELQDKHRIQSGDEALEHIRAYEANLRELELVRKYVGRLENLVLSTGQDTGKLIGGYKTSARPRRDVELSDDEYKTAVIRITVRNTSPDASREENIRYSFPPEIKVNDILDSAGLDIDNDVKTGTCFVFKNAVVIPPEETITYEVKIRDKWNVNHYRFGALREFAQDVLNRVSARNRYKSVEDRLAELIAEIDGIEREDTPEVLDDKYVAYFRNQSSRLDLIEQKINRIESALRPMQKPPEWGFPIKPPSMKTTWLIIYIILGFLALLSLLFFLRWFGGGSGSGTGSPPGGR
jgi:hypothetical protein